MLDQRHLTERARRACRVLAPVDLYTMLRVWLGDRRGWHVYQFHGDPAGAIGCHPRTTCGDVSRLTALCASSLGDATSTARERWEQVARQATRICAGLDDAIEYPRNRGYWRALRDLAIAAQSRPRNESDDLNAWRAGAVPHEGGAPRVSAENVAFIHIQNALHYHFGDRRGWDTLTVQVKQKDGTTRPSVRKWPRTTCGDVAQLAAFWTREISNGPQNYGEMVPGSQRRTWSAAASAVTQRCAGTPDAVYPENRAFWKAMQGAAISIDVENDNVPRSKFDALVGNFSDVVSAIGAGLSDAASWTGDRLKGAARTVGEGAGGLFGGFLDAIGFKELLIGAGLVVGAIVIVPKLMNDNPKEG